jgi:hypothetical protein
MFWKEDRSQTYCKRKILTKELKNDTRGNYPPSQVRKETG